MTGQPAVADRSDDTASTVDTLASRLLRAQAERTALSPLVDEYPALDTAMAYRVQDEALSRRIERGESIVGIKLGLTSAAKQRQMGVSAPLTAWLTDAMVLPTGTPLPQDLLIHPRVEPEITFVMGRRLAGPGVTAATALAAVDRVFASVEIIDSRYRDFRFTLPEVIADNASAAYFVTGAVGADPTALNLPLEACLLEVDGGVVATGVGAAVQGHPAEALAMAANVLAERGHAIEAGWIVMTGGMTDAVAAPRGSTLGAHFTHLGSVGLTC
ncbi:MULTISPECIES: 2-keto-4-pentenoate hydratase [Nocardia]|uniref:2-hydroxypent-2,4-dienoate hydratase n=1 Tax=Nocardia farcinica TaxID=37329 RepID=A0A449H0L7_NOCFR|nr:MULTISPECIES: 4-oxalocrotonate decarboxylase [Nocardia]UEX21146.1 4-oxalocrotonate decarboxylase [Nocardia farcinica]VFA91583.1 2-hydroxypent-2,4-dienoate hydratase [Nocardia farcinica]